MRFGQEVQALPRQAELNPTAQPRVIDVVAGILHADDGTVLLQRRPAGREHAGFWEFPGGKREPGEAALAALARELAEELAITVLAAEPFERLTHDYPLRTVRLDFWRVQRWSGQPEPREGQQLGWFAPDALPGDDLLPANHPIAKRLAAAHARRAGA